MYAILKTGGKQYKVEKDSKLLVEKIAGKTGDEVVLNEVLMVGDGKKLNLGTPNIQDAAVLAEVVRQTRGPKITIIYKRRRKNSRRKQGHKQDLTLLKVLKILETGGSKILPKKSTDIKLDKKVVNKTKISASKTELSKDKKIQPNDKDTKTKNDSTSKPKVANKKKV